MYNTYIYEVVHFLPKNTVSQGYKHICTYNVHDYNNQIVDRNIFLLTDDLCESHLLRLYFCVFQPSVVNVQCAND